LFPIQHRSTEVRQDLVVLRARDALVSVRTELIMEYVEGTTLAERIQEGPVPLAALESSESAGLRPRETAGHADCGGRECHALAHTRHGGHTGGSTHGYGVYVSRAGPRRGQAVGREDFFDRRRRPK
jgi:hypothetical protein